MKFNKIIAFGVLAVALTGCATSRRVPTKAIDKTSGDVFYATRRVSAPKDIVYRPVTDAQVSAQGISPDVIAAIVGGGVQIAEGWIKTKENILTEDTEIFMTGSNVSDKAIFQALKSLKVPIDAEK
jgi:hypothetical protein